MSAVAVVPDDEHPGAGQHNATCLTRGQKSHYVRRHEPVAVVPGFRHVVEVGDDRSPYLPELGRKRIVRSVAKRLSLQVHAALGGVSDHRRRRPLPHRALEPSCSSS